MSRASARLEAATTVPTEFFDALLDALDAPPVANQALSEAALRARDLVIRS